VHEGSVEAPGKALGEGGGGHLGGPVVVGRVSVSGQALLVERLHEAVELGPEPALAEVRAGVDEVAFALAPLGAPVLEPHLRATGSRQYMLLYNILF